MSDIRPVRDATTYTWAAVNDHTFDLSEPLDVPAGGFVAITDDHKRVGAYDADGNLLGSAVLTRRGVAR